MKQDDPGSYFVDILGLGETMDIMPYVREAMSNCRYRHDFSPFEVAELTESAVRGGYIRVSTLDRIEDRMLGVLTGTIIMWIQSEYRLSQITDPDLRKLRPYVELVTGPHWCARAEAARGRWLQPEHLERLPFPDCDCDHCTCGFLTHSKGDIEKRGTRPVGQI